MTTSILLAALTSVMVAQSDDVLHGAASVRDFRQQETAEHREQSRRFDRLYRKALQNKGYNARTTGRGGMRPDNLLDNIHTGVRTSGFKAERISARNIRANARDIWRGRYRTSRGDVRLPFDGSSRVFRTENGYRIRYPDHWTVERQPSDDTVYFVNTQDQVVAELTCPVVDITYNPHEWSVQDSSRSFHKSGQTHGVLHRRSLHYTTQEVHSSLILHRNTLNDWAKNSLDAEHSCRIDFDNSVSEHERFVDDIFDHVE